MSTPQNRTYDTPFEPIITLEQWSGLSPSEILDACGIDLHELPSELQPSTEAEAATIANAAAMAHWATNGDENWGELYNYGNLDLIRFWVDRYREIEAGHSTAESMIEVRYHRDSSDQEAS
jgi:hypothetical protein